MPEDENHVVQTVATSRCPSCGSTQRGPYYGTTVNAVPGLDSSGNAYTHVVRRRTKCKNCGARRIDRTFDQR